MEEATWTLVVFTAFLAIAAILSPLISWHFKKKELIITRTLQSNKIMINQNFEFSKNPEFGIPNQKTQELNKLKIKMNYECVDFLLRKKSINTDLIFKEKYKNEKNRQKNIINNKEKWKRRYDGIKNTKIGKGEK